MLGLALAFEQVIKVHSFFPPPILELLLQKLGFGKLSKTLRLLVAAEPLALVCQNPRSQSKESDGKLQITWDNPKELELYISKLQSAAEKLSTENRKLRKWHTDFIEKVLLSPSVSPLTFTLSPVQFFFFKF